MRSKIYLFVVFFALFIHSCQWTVIQLAPSISSIPSVNMKQVTSSKIFLPNLVIIPKLHSSHKKELENFCSMLHNIIVPYAYVLDYRVIRQIPPSISPLDSATFFRLKLARADFLLYVAINFRQRVSIQDHRISWTYGQAKLRLISQLNGRCLWRLDEHLKQGVVNWKGIPYAKHIVAKRLVRRLKKEIIKRLKSLPPLVKNQIKITVQLDTREQLEIFQEELERLEQSGYYKIIQAPILLSPMLMLTLQYSDSLFHLASLLKEACLSRGIKIWVNIGRQFLSIKNLD